MNFENVSSVDVEQAQYLEVKKTNSAMKMAGLFFFLLENSSSFISGNNHLLCRIFSCLEVNS